MIFHLCNVICFFITRFLLGFLVLLGFLYSFSRLLVCAITRSEIFGIHRDDDFLPFSGII